MEDRSTPAVTASLLAGGALDIAFGATNDTATISISGANLTVASNSGNTVFSQAAVQSMNAHSTAGTGQSITFTGTKTLTGGIVATGLDNVTFTAVNYFTHGLNVNAKGNITFNGGSYSATNSGDIELTSIVTVNAATNGALGSTANAASQVKILGAGLTAANITIDCETNITADAEGDTASDTNRDFSRLSSTSSAIVTINDIAILNADGGISITAKSHVVTSSTAEAKTTSTNAAIDAAIATSTIDSTAKIEVLDSARLDAVDILSLNAINDTSVTTIADGTTSNATGKGGSVAIAKVSKTTLVTVATSDLIDADDIDITSNSITNSTTTAKSSVGGSTTNDASTTTELNSAGATTADGSVGLSAAVAIHRLLSDNTATTVNMTGTIGTRGSVNINANATTNGTVLADASNTGAGQVTPPAGVGVAVAINKGAPSHVATLTGTPILNTPGVTIFALEPTAGVHNTTATAGVGAANVGVAGALAITDIDKTSTAKIGSAFENDLGAVVFTINASGNSSETTNANAAQQIISGNPRFGVGGSAAFNRSNRTTKAEIEDGANIIGGAGYSFNASSNHVTNTNATVGSAGGIAVSAGVALAQNVNDTFARLGTGTSFLDLNGANVTLVANHIGSTTVTVHGETAGTNVAVGAELAMADVADKAHVNIDRSVDTANLTGSANTSSFVSSTATGSAKGTTSSQTANQQVDQQDNNASRPSAQTADGAFGAAAALAINVAISESKVILANGIQVSGGSVVLASANETDTLAKADASVLADTNQATTVGLAAAVAINKSTITNETTVGTNAFLSANTLTVQATMRDGVGSHSAEANAISGAGGRKVGVAGALALNIQDNVTQAVVKAGATINGATGAVNLSAVNRRIENAKASPGAGGVAGDSVGVGASVAINILDNTTRAEIEDTARVTQSASLSVTATSVETVLTDAKGGAGSQTSAGAIAVTPVVALTELDDVTTARIGKLNATPTTTSGAATLSATHTGSTTTKAEGSTVATQVAAGLSLALSVEDIDTTATIGSLTAGSSTATASSVAASVMSAKANAKGGETSSGTNVDQKTTSQKNFGDAQAGETHGTSDSASSKEGAVALAGAVAVRIGTVDTHAGVEAAGKLTTTGAFSAQALENVDTTIDAFADTVGTGSQNGASGLGIAAAVGINTSTTNTLADIGAGATVSTHKLTLQSTMTTSGGNSISASDVEAVSGVGNTGVGFAGALAINKDTHDNAALLSSSSTIGTGLGGDDLSILADNTTTANADARASITGSGASAKVGVGASVAINLLNRTTHAEIEHAVVTTGGDDALISASSNHTATTSSTIGNTGGVAVSPGLALSVVNSNTFSKIVTGNQITAPGFLSISASHTGSTTTTAHGETAGSNVAVGAVLAINDINDKADVTIGRSVNFGVGINGATNTKSTSVANAFGSTKGTASTQQADAQINQQQTIADRNSAETSDGKLAAAAALAVNVARSESKTTTSGVSTLTSAGAIVLTSANETDSSATGDSTALGDGSANPTVGVAVGLGLNKTVITNEASLAGTTTANSLGLTLTANMRDGSGRHDSLAAGSAGAGGKKVGIAGSLGLNIVDNQTIAAVRGTSVVNAGTGAINITATNRRNETARAVPRADGGSGTTVGVGASVAINVVDNVTRAEVENGSRISAAGATTLTANSAETVLTDSTGGSGRQDGSGNITITPTVALSVVDDSTLARIGTSTISSALAGPLTLNATHTGGTTTSAIGTTTASSVAVGVSLALAVEKIETKATVGKANVSGANAVAMTANSQTTSSVIAKASAKGGEATASPAIDVKVSEQKNFADSESGTTHTSANSAQTSDGGVNVAAAVGVRVGNVDAIAGVESSGLLFSGSSLTVTAKQNSDVTMTVDGLAVGTGSQNGQPASGLGVAAAVAINTSTTTTEAKIADNALITVRGLKLETGVLPVGADTTSTTAVSATSGIGNSAVGVAGSLALNVDRHISTAKVDLGAAMAVGSGTPLDTDDFTLIANNNTSSSATANAKITGSGGSTKAGVGASVALEIVKNETIATVESNASFGGADDVSVTATGTHVNNATAEAGSAGAVAVSPAVALVVATGDTIAQVKNGANTTMGDDVLIQATRSNTSTSIAGATAAAGDVAVGVAIALTVAEDDVTATLDRNLTSATGTLDIVAVNTSATFATSTASSKGGPTAGDDSDQSTQNQQDFGQNLSGGGTGGSNFSTKVGNAKTNLKANSNNKGGTDVSDNSNAFAAAIAVNVTAPTTIASITNTTGGRNITMGGAVAVRTDVDTTSKATANGTAVSGGADNGTAIGAALGVNVGVITNTAKVGSGIINAPGITIRADHGAGDDHSFRAEAIAGGGGGQTTVAASLALNVVDDTTTATAESNADLNSTGAVLIRADNDVRVLSVAGGVAAGLNRGVGAALSGNVVNNTTFASIGSSATVDAVGSITVEGDASIAPLVDGVSQNPMAVAAGGAGTIGNGVAGSAAVNVIVETTTVAVETFATVASTAGAGELGDITVRATDATTLKSGGGTVVASAGNGFGAGIAVDVLVKTVQAFIAGTTNVGVGVNAVNDVLVQANSTEVQTGFGAALSFTQGTGIAGGAVVYVPTTTTEAFVGAGRVMQSTGNFKVSANHDADINTFAGAVSGGASQSVGIAVSAVIANDTVEAALAGGITLTTAGAIGVTVEAVNDIDVTPRSIGGAGSAGGNMAGSGNAIVLTQSTLSHIDPLCIINAVNAAAGIDPSIVVTAASDTHNFGVAGTASGSGSIGAAAGADTLVVTKHTQAWIADRVTANADKNIKTIATSTEKFVSVAASASGGGTAGLAGAAGALVANITTQAVMGDDPTDAIVPAGSANIHASGNILIAATDDTQVDMLAGTLTVGGTASVGASVAVPVIHKLTEAYVARIAHVTGDGNGTTENYRSGQFTVTFPADVAGFGEVTVADPPASDQDGAGGDDITDLQLAHSRLATPTVLAYRGVAVSASSTDDIEVLTVGGGASGSVAVNVAAPVAILDSKTHSFVDTSAQVNNDLSTANAAQNVFVVAGSDQAYFAFSGTGSVGGLVAVGPTANVAVIDNETKAFVNISSTVRSKNFVNIHAFANEDILVLAAGVAASGTASVAGSVNVLDFDGTTYAAIEDGATVLALETVNVLATDTTDIDAISGAATVGGVAGIGGSVNVVSINKDTQAYIDDNATVDGKATGGSTGSGHGVMVTATSSENVTNLAVAAGLGVFAGVAGGVSVNVIDSDTSAFIDNGAHVNDDTSGVAARQNVELRATNTLTVKSVAGGFSAGVGSLAGAVDVGSVRNETNAFIGANADVKAAQDVIVAANATRNVGSFALSAAVGGVALAGSVSVWALGSTFDSNYSNDAGTIKNSMQGSVTSGPAENQFADQFAGNQGSQGHSRVSSILDGYQRPAAGDLNPTPLKRVGQAMFDRSNEIIAAGPSQANTVNDLRSTNSSAKTRAEAKTGSQVTAGGDISITAIESNDFDTTTGELSGGLLGAGAAVTILKFSPNTEAVVDGSMFAGDDVIIKAQMTAGTAGDQMKLQSFAGNLGFIGLGAAVVVVTDNSRQSAVVDTNANIDNADDVDIDSIENENVFLDARQAAAGFVAAGASFTRFTKDTDAVVFPAINVNEAVVRGTVGQGGTVNDLFIDATQSLFVDARSTAMAGGLGAAITGSFVEINVRDSSQFAPSVHASIESANIAVVGNLSNNATANQTLRANSKGANVGAIAAGASKATIRETPFVAAEIGDSTITVGNDINMAATVTLAPHAVATSTSGALITVSGELLGTSSLIEVFPRVHSIISESIEIGKTNVNAGGNVTVASNTTINPHVRGTSDAVGLVGSGTSHAAIKIYPSGFATTSGEIELNAGGNFTLACNLTVEADSFDNPANEIANSKSTADGFVATCFAGTVVDVQPDFETIIGDNGLIVAGGLIQLDAKIVDIYILSTATADGDGVLHTTTNAVNKSHIGDFSTIGEEFANGAAVRSSIGDGAVVTGNAVEVLATVNSATVYALSDSIADNGLVTPNSTGWAQMSIFTTTEIRPGAFVRGDDHIDVKSRNEILENILVVLSTDDGRTDRDTIVEAQNTQTTTARVFGEDNALLVTRKLNVEAISLTHTVSTTAVSNFDTEADFTRVFKPARFIEWDSDVEILSAANPTLVIDANGNVETSINASVASSNATTIFVAPIANNPPFTPYEPIKFKVNKVTTLSNTLEGTIAGFNSTFTFDRTFDTVTIQNFSAKDLVIDNIGVISTVTPTVVLDVEDLTAVSIHFAFNTLHRYNPTVIDIQNLGSTGSPDIILDSILNNPIGELHITNPRGDILAQGRNSHTTSKLFLSALGDIGSAATRMKVNLIQSAESSIVVSAAAGGSVHLDFKGFLRQLPGTQTFVIPISTLTAGGDIDLRIQDSQKQIVENPSRPSVNVNEIFPPPTTTVNVLGRYLPPIEETLLPLPLGIFGTSSVQINTTYSFAGTTAGGDFEATAVGGFSVITLSGVINMSGAGSMQLTHFNGNALTLNGGTGNNAFGLDDWGGAVSINGQAGTDTLSLTNFDGSVNSVDQLVLQGVSTRPGTVTASISGSVRIDDVVVFNIADIAGVARDLLVNASIAGSGTLIKQGLGGMNATNNASATTWFGIVRIDAGFYGVDGNFPASQILLNGGTLAGAGTAGPVSGIRGHAGTISPNQDPTLPGNLTTQQLTLVAGNVDLVQLNGLSAGFTYDQIDVTGSVLLGGSTLSGTLGFTSAVGDVFRIIDNDGTDAVIGTFLNLPEGSFFFIGAVKFQVSYVGGTGNDVILTHVNTNSAFGNRSITARTNEGNIVNVSGNIVEPDALDSFTLIVNWGDGVTETFNFPAGSGGLAVSIDHRYLDNPGSGTQYPVFMDWRDQHGGGNQVTLFTQIDNVAPTLAGTGPSSLLRGQAGTFSLTADDVSSIDRAANFRFAINWGDGQTQIVNGPRLQTLRHGYNAAGNFNVSITAFDKDNAPSTAFTKTVNVQALTLANGELSIGGTTASDTILVQPIDTAGSFLVNVNGVSQGTFAGVQKISVYSGDGNDTILFRTAIIGGKAERINVPVFADAGSGNDSLLAEGTNAGAILLGGDGADLIYGGYGRDVLFGGGGRDVIRGNGNDDCLVGGSTVHDASRSALDSIFAEWKRTDATRQQRIDHLKGTTAGGLNGAFKLNQPSLIDDNALDQMLSDFGVDWLAGN